MMGLPVRVSVSMRTPGDEGTGDCPRIGQYSIPTRIDALPPNRWNVLKVSPKSSS
jgi:hypothetical protein